MTRQSLVPLLLPADPANPLEAATKQYVDGKAGGLSAKGYIAGTTDLNTVIVDGIYSADLASTTPNGPPIHYSYEYGTFIVMTSGYATGGMSSGYKYLTQMFVRTFYISYRIGYSTNGTTWSWEGWATTASNELTITNLSSSTVTQSFSPGMYYRFTGAGLTLTVSNAADQSIPLGAEIHGVSTTDPLTMIAASSVTINSAGGLVVPTDVVWRLVKVDTNTWDLDFASGGGGGAAPTGTKLTDLTSQTGAGAATADLIETVDVSDTTMAASGTNKKMTLAELVIWLNANGITIVDNAVTNVKLADMVQSTIKGRTAGAGTGDPVDLTAAQAKTILAITGADLATDSVTNTQLQPMATLTLKGNSTGATAGPQDLTVAAVKTMLGIDNITVSNTAPSSPSVNDLWVDTT